MRYDTVIFDLDGTLLDTLQDLADSVNYALNVNALPQRTVDEVRRFVGSGVARLVARAVPEGTPEGLVSKVLADFRAHYVLNMENRTAPLPGRAGAAAAAARGRLSPCHCLQQIRRRREGPGPGLF